jgi:hypothetical protein
LYWVVADAFNRLSRERSTSGIGRTSAERHSRYGKKYGVF